MDMRRELVVVLKRPASCAWDWTLWRCVPEGGYCCCTIPWELVQMSGQPTVNIVDNDEMSSQGSVNAPMVAPNTAAQVQALW